MITIVRLPLSQVLSSKLTELDSLIHRLLSLEEQLSSSDMGLGPVDNTLTSSLSVLMSRLMQTVWPTLAVIGGLDSGFCIGRSCTLEGLGEGVEALIVSIPDAEEFVEVEKRITDSNLHKLKRYH